MTEQEAKNKLVDLARSQLGYREGANNYNKYAADPMITRLYGWIPQNQPWCCTFVNWCFLTAFGYDAGSKLTYGGTAACSNSAQLFMNNGAYVHFPQIGDQAFFYSSGGINHTGIVVAVDGTIFKTIEGNYSDKVSEVTHNVGSSDVAGFGRPNWPIVAKEAAPSQTSNQSKPANTSTASQEDHSWEPLLLTRSNKYSSDCVILQGLLNRRKWSCGEVDGFFGPKTEAATNKARVWFGLEPNGKCDIELWKKLVTFGKEK